MSGTYCTFCGNKLIYCNCYGIREAAPKAEGPARNEPEQSTSLPPGSTSGVVEALAQQLARDIDACLTSTQIAERALALLATPPQAPATPAAVPVEVQKISYPNVGENGYGVDVDYYRRELARLAESLPNRPGDELARYLRNLADTAAPQAPAPGSQGAEAPRKAAIGCLLGRDIDAIEAALDIADRKTDAFDAARAAVAGLRNLRASLEADATGGVTDKLRERLMQRIDENNILVAKTESLEAEVKKREQQIADFARRTGDEMECLQAKLRALEGAAREAADNLVDARESLKFGSHEYICVVAAHDVLRDALGDPRPAKREIQETPTSEAAIRSLLCRAALRGWRRGRRNQDPAQEEIADDLLLDAGAAPEEEGANAQ